MCKSLTNIFSYKPSIAKYKKTASSIKHCDGYEHLIFEDRYDSVILTKDQNLKDALDVFRGTYFVDSQLAVNIEKAFQTFGELKNLKLTAFLGKGCHMQAFLLNNNKVLKVAERSNYSAINNANIRVSFDTTLEAETSILGTVDNYTYSLQEFGIPNVSRYGLYRLAKRLRKRGAYIDDWGRHQCARFKDNRTQLIRNPFGIIKVVDLGCIIPPQYVDRVSFESFS